MVIFRVLISICTLRIQILIYYLRLICSNLYLHRYRTKNNKFILPLCSRAKIKEYKMTRIFFRMNGSNDNILSTIESDLDKMAKRLESSTRPKRPRPAPNLNLSMTSSNSSMPSSARTKPGRYCKLFRKY